MNYSKTLLGPIYRLQGVAGVLTIRGTDYSLTRVMDKSAGISLAGAAEIETMRPAAAIRVSELTGLALTIDDLERQQISFNGKSWLITSIKPISSPNGEGDGEAYLMLEAI